MIKRFIQRKFFAKDKNIHQDLRKTHQEDFIFVTTIYGSRHLPFLAPHLLSVLNSNPGKKEIVLWDDLPSDQINLIQQCFPLVSFIHMQERIQGTIDQKISRKLNYWLQACKLFPDTKIVFIDTDTLVLKSIENLISGSYDFLFTWKDEVYPINTGVIAVRNGKRVLPIITEWVTRIEKIISNQQDLNLALVRSGAADQHALREIIGYINYDRPFIRQINGEEYLFRGVNCQLLNETNCSVISEDTHVIHYKGGWHPLILEKKGYSVNRPKERCQEMHLKWLDMTEQVEKLLCETLVINSVKEGYEKFKAILPSYEERGILNSEMLAVCAISEALKVDIIIESGRCRGQSTLVLAKYFSGSQVKIISIELERDNNADFAEIRLEGFENTQLLYGNSLDLIPEICRNCSDQKIALLIDGPKGKIAIDLITDIFKANDNVPVAFLHDTRKGSDARRITEQLFLRRYYTDYEKYIENFSNLDDSCLPQSGSPITTHTWRPYHKGEDLIESYGPTLAILFPNINL